MLISVSDGGDALVEVVLSTDANEAFKDIDFAILLGGFPRKEGMERKDLIAKNVAIFKVQGTALNKVAKKTVKVLGCRKGLFCGKLSRWIVGRFWWWQTRPIPTAWSVRITRQIFPSPTLQL